MAEATAAQESATPALDAMLKDFMADYKAGTLPPEIQQRMDGAFENYRNKVNDDVADLKDNATNWVNDLKSEAANVAADYLATHPDIQSLQELNKDNLDTAGFMASGREMVHKFIEVNDVLREFVDDALHDTVDTARDVLDIRAVGDEDGALSAKLEAAQIELDVAEIKLDEALDQWSSETEKAQDSVDAVADFAEEHPVEFNAQIRHHHEMEGKANSVEPDAAEIGETATA